MEPTIIITTEENKKDILRTNSKKHLFHNLKFFTFQDLKHQLFFDYDEQTILFVVRKYHVSIAVAKIYLDHLYFLKDLDYDKVQFLNELKKELDDNHLLIYHDNFAQMFQGKKVIVYGYPVLLKEQQMILDQLNVPIFYQNSNSFYTPTIFEALSLDDEVEFVMQEIMKLIQKKVSLSHIKIIASNEYNHVLMRYFNIFHLPFNKESKHSYYSTMLAQEFLAHYDQLSIEENILDLSEKYQNVNELVDIINRSVSIFSKDERKDFIIEDLKKIKLKEVIYDEAISIVDIHTSFSDDDYVFLLGFNVNEYPKIKRDIDYFSDEIKKDLGLDTTTDYNNYQKNIILNQIHQIKNLVITYKLRSSTGVFYPSMLIKELGGEVLPIFIDQSFSYSKLYSELKYAQALDNLYKFNIISSDLALFQSSLLIPYQQYDNQFTGVSKELIQDKFDHQLVLSYTNLEMYRECAFHYYISKVLHLDIFLESFKTILGSIMHHILELGLVKDIDIAVEMMKFVKEKEYVLNAKEMFYLEEFSKELSLVLEIIRKQQKHSELNHYLFEQEFYVYKDVEDMNITFKGNIDKVMYKEVSGHEVLAVVDYKTGNTNITLKDLDYGLHIQLPIYLYLLKKSDRFHDALIAGFYIQKVLVKKEAIELNKSIQELLENRLRLQGFTNAREDLMELIDDEYQDSKIIQNLKFKKDGTISSTSKVLSNKEMDEVIDQVDLIIDDTIHSILKGEFSINPKVINGKNVACTYCKFKDLCFRKKKDEVVLGGDSDEVDEGTVACN